MLEEDDSPYCDNKTRGRLVALLSGGELDFDLFLFCLLLVSFEITLLPTFDKAKVPPDQLLTEGPWLELKYPEFLPRPDAGTFSTPLTAAAIVVAVAAAPPLFRDRLSLSSEILLSMRPIMALSVAVKTSNPTHAFCTSFHVGGKTKQRR